MKVEYFVGYRFPRERWELKSDPTPNLVEALEIFHSVRSRNNFLHYPVDLYEKRGTQIRRIRGGELEGLLDVRPTTKKRSHYVNQLASDCN